MSRRIPPVTLPPFLAFDTETATPQGEACAIAMVRFEDGRPAWRHVTLVRPPVPIWTGFTRIHGIRNADVARAPDWTAVWAELGPHLTGGLPLVAHNAAFDLGVLRRNNLACGLPLPELPLHCTVRMARRLWPQLVNHKLDTVAGHLGLELHHHEALSDALACGHIAAAALRTWGGWAPRAD